MSGSRKTLNLKVLAIAVVMLILTAVSAFYAMRQDYSLHLSLDVDTAKLGNDFCAAAYNYANRSHQTYATIINGKLSLKVPASTRAIIIVTVRDGNTPDQLLVDNDKVNRSVVTKIAVNDREVGAEGLLQALRQTRERMHGRFIFLAVLAGVIVAAAICGGYYLYCVKERVNALIFKAETALRLYLKSPAILFQNKKFRFAFLLVLAVVVLIWRKPGQLWYPNIFIEDSNFILNDYLLYGMQSLFMPVNGYFITISKIINILAFKISFWYYAELAAFMANLFIIFVIFAIAYAPTHLKYPYLCAVMTLLLKTGAECFGVALYTFWWAGLLIALAVLWQSGKRPVLRIVFLVVGGLSSPIVFVAAPLMVFLALYKRNRGNIVSAVVIVIICLIQIFPVLAFKGGQHESLFSLDAIIAAVRTILGSYMLPQTAGFWLLLLCGVVMAVILITQLKFNTRSLKGFIDNNLYYLLLLAWLAGAIASSLYRANWVNTDRHPLAFYEHRYYFYPFVFLTWINVWIIAALPNLYPKIVLKIFMFLVLFNCIFGGAWKLMPMATPDIGWQARLALCVTGHTDGILTVANSRLVRFYEMSPEACRGLVENSLFFNDVETNLQRFKDAK